MEHDILRFEVVVDYLLRREVIEVIESFEYLEHDPLGLVLGQTSLPPEVL